MEPLVGWVRKWGMLARIRNMGPSTLTAKRARHIAVGVSATRAEDQNESVMRKRTWQHRKVWFVPKLSMMPAQLTRTSRRPKCLWTWFTADWASSSMATLYCRLSWLLVSDFLGSAMSMQPTFAPCERKSDTMAAPMPAAPPVTRQTWGS